MTHELYFTHVCKLVSHVWYFMRGQAARKLAVTRAEFLIHVKAGVTLALFYMHVQAAVTCVVSHVVKLYVSSLSQLLNFTHMFKLLSHRLYFTRGISLVSKLDVNSLSHVLYFTHMCSSCYHKCSISRMVQDVNLFYIHILQCSAVTQLRCGCLLYTSDAADE